MKKIISASAVLVVMLAISGCGSTTPDATTTPTTPAATTAPATTSVATSSDSFKELVNRLNTAKLAFVEENQAENVKRMTNAASITASTRYVLQGGNRSVTVSVAETKDAASAALVKKEIEGQMAMLKEFSPESTSKFINSESPTLVITLTYDKGDEETAGVAETALLDLKITK